MIPFGWHRRCALLSPRSNGHINIISAPRWPVTGELMTRSPGGTRGDTQDGLRAGRGYLRGQRPRTQSDFNEPPDILGCPMQRVWLPGVAPSPKEISRSL